MPPFIADPLRLQLSLMNNMAERTQAANPIVHANCDQQVPASTLHAEASMVPSQNAALFPNNPAVHQDILLQEIVAFVSLRAVTLSVLVANRYTGQSPQHAYRNSRKKSRGNQTRSGLRVRSPISIMPRRSESSLQVSMQYAPRHERATGKQRSPACDPSSPRLSPLSRG